MVEDVVCVLWHVDSHVGPRAAPLLLERGLAYLIKRPKGLVIFQTAS